MISDPVVFRKPVWTWSFNLTNKLRRNRDLFWNFLFLVYFLLTFQVQPVFLICKQHSNIVNNTIFLPFKKYRPTHKWTNRKLNFNKKKLYSLYSIGQTRSSNETPSLKDSGWSLKNFHVAQSSIEKYVWRKRLRLKIYLELTDEDVAFEDLPYMFNMNFLERVINCCILLPTRELLVTIFPVHWTKRDF